MGFSIDLSRWRTAVSTCGRGEGDERVEPQTTRRHADISLDGPARGDGYPTTYCCSPAQAIPISSVWSCGLRHHDT